VMGRPRCLNRVNMHITIAEWSDGFSWIAYIPQRLGPAYGSAETYEQAAADALEAVRRMMESDERKVGDE